MKSDLILEKPVEDIQQAVEHIQDISYELKTPEDLDPLMKKIGNARYVLLGEASHGTHEYYTWRTEITKRLIKEKNFSFIAVEGDWPDCYRINRFIKGYRESGTTAGEVLKTFKRWPTWMWANWEMIELTEWLHGNNKELPEAKKTGFYGLDVYILWESLEAIVKFLEKTDHKVLESAKKVLNCFEPYSRDEGQAYARAAFEIPISCEKELVDLLTEIRQNLPSFDTDREATLGAEQNAIVALNAERYYKAALKGGPESWNIRDRHMVSTLNRLMRYYGPKAKAIVWEHNTHIGDARATNMKKEGMINVGQLLNEQHNDNDIVKVGFGSYQGSVIAAKKWGGNIRRMPVPPAPAKTWEYLLHKAGNKNKLIISDDLKKQEQFKQPMGHRAIGVVYSPQNERLGNYVPSVIPFRYDAFIYIDETTALHPLHITPNGYQIPETYPWGE